MNTVYMTGLLQLPQNWLTDTYKWMLLLDTFTPDELTDIFVADVSAFELTDGSYSRVTASGKLESNLIPTSPLVAYSATDPDFGSLVGGEGIGWIVLYHEVTTDADSELVCAQQLSRVTDSTNVTIEFTTAGPSLIGFLTLTRAPGAFGV